MQMKREKKIETSGVLVFRTTIHKLLIKKIIIKTNKKNIFKLISRKAETTIRQVYEIMAISEFVNANAFSAKTAKKNGNQISQRKIINIIFFFSFFFLLCYAIWTFAKILRVNLSFASTIYKSIFHHVTIHLCISNGFIQFCLCNEMKIKTLSQP